MICAAPVEEFAVNMSDTQAKDHYECIKNAIKNPPATAKEDVKEDDKAAKRFLKNVEHHEKN